MFGNFTCRKDSGGAAGDLQCGFVSGNITTDPTARGFADIYVQNFCPDVNDKVTNYGQLQVNDSGQVKYNANTVTDHTMTIRTKGWLWSRGR
jgi:hypothetical protein